MLPRPLLPVGCNFYPRPPRGGRHELISKASKTFEISIHALREEGDLSNKWGAVHTPISIHALREEGDAKPDFCSAVVVDFYPRPPRGGRRQNVVLAAQVVNFYPRPPRGGRREVFAVHLHEIRFLSTPSARRATSLHLPRVRRSGDFYPRPPRGGRQQKQRQNLYFQTNYTTFCTNLEEP